MMPINPIAINFGANAGLTPQQAATALASTYINRALVPDYIARAPLPNIVPRVALDPEFVMGVEKWYDTERERAMGAKSAQTEKVGKAAGLAADLKNMEELEVVDPNTKEKFKIPAKEALDYAKFMEMVRANRAQESLAASKEGGLGSLSSWDPMKWYMLQLASQTGALPPDMYGKVIAAQPAQSAEQAKARSAADIFSSDYEGNALKLIPPRRFVEMRTKYNVDLSTAQKYAVLEKMVQDAKNVYPGVEFNAVPGKGVYRRNEEKKGWELFRPYSF